MSDEDAGRRREPSAAQHGDISMGREVFRSERDRMPRWVPRAILLLLGGVVLLAAMSWMFSRLRSFLIMVLVSLFLSFAIEPAVNRLAARGWRRETRFH